MRGGGAAGSAVLNGMVYVSSIVPRPPDVEFDTGQHDAFEVTSR